MDNQPKSFGENDAGWSRRRFISVGAGAAISLGAAACGASSKTASTTKKAASTTKKKLVGEGKTIGLSLNGFNVYNQYNATGVLKALEGTAYKFVGVQANYNSTQEVSNFETLISRGVDGIVFIPNTTQSATRGALAAHAAGIPVVDFLWEGQTAADSTFVGRVLLDNEVGGKATAKWITENTHPGEIVVITGVPGQGFSEEVLKGVQDGLREYGAGKWKIVGVQPGLFSRTVAITAAQNLLTANPNAKIIVDFASEMGDGIASYLQQSGKTDIANITTDGNEEMVGLMRSGKIKADRYYSAAEEARLGTMLLRKFLETGQKSGVVPQRQGIVTKKNLDYWLKNVPLVYPEYLKTVAKIG